MISNSTNIFQMGWNHQLDGVPRLFQRETTCNFSPRSQRFSHLWMPLLMSSTQGGSKLDAIGKISKIFMLLWFCLKYFKIIFRKFEGFECLVSFYSPGWGAFRFFLGIGVCPVDRFVFWHRRCQLFAEVEEVHTSFDVQESSRSRVDSFAVFDQFSWLETWSNCYKHI